MEPLDLRVPKDSREKLAFRVRLDSPDPPVFVVSLVHQVPLDYKDL